MELHYYFYISETKVSQLLAQLDDGTLEKTCELNEEYDALKSSFSSNLLSLLNIEASFGKQNKLSMSKEKRANLVTNLVVAVNALKDKIGILPNLNKMLMDGAPILPGYYIYEGNFVVENTDNDFAYLVSINKSCRIELTCSLKYFSDMLNKSRPYIPHSGNQIFFSGKISPDFLCGIYVLEANNGVLSGTPLFLALPLKSPIG